MRLSAGFWLVAVSLLCSCGLNQQGVPPLDDTIAFPSSALVDPSGRWLFVVNANSDLRYNNGTLVALDLAAAAADRPAAGDAITAAPPVFPDCPQVAYIHPLSDPNTHYCCWDQLDDTILDCDERQYVASASTVRIGSFGAGMVYEPACDDALADPGAGARCPDHWTCRDNLANQGRLFIGVRGNSSLTYLDVTVNPGQAPVFDCSVADAGPFAECDVAHQITHATQTFAGDVLLPDEPYALALDRRNELLYVGHLRGDVSRPDTGGVSLFDVQGLPTAEGVRQPRPKFVRPFGSIFPGDANGLVGVTSLGVSASGELFVSSRYVPRVGSMVPTNLAGCDTNTDASLTALVQAGDTFDTALFGSEARGIQFIPDANRAFVLQRVPPALVGFDLDRDPLTGLYRPTDVIETCASPTYLQSHNPGGTGWQLYVTCFETGQIYVVDPYIPRLVSVIDVGRGPAGLAFGPAPGESNVPPADSTTTRGYVVGFGDNDISVVDLSPGSPTQYHVIQRLGFPSTVPR